MNEKFRSVFSTFFSRFEGLGHLTWPYKVMLGAIILGIIFLILPPSLFDPFRCESLQARRNFQASRGFFIDNQVIVTGTQEDIITVLGTHDESGNPVSPGVAGVNLNLIESCDLSYLNTRKNPDPALTEQQRETLAMQLFEIRDVADTTENVVSRINAARGDEPTNPKYYVFADPNYLTSLLDLTIDTCSLPNGSGGSGGGKEFGDPGILVLSSATASNAFPNQWAFTGSQGINLILPPSSGLDGQEVRVGVFDTAPFPTPYPAFSRIGIALPSPLWFTTKNAAGTTLTSNHGLFVAGLIHGIAPKSRIQLIRVLNDEGCGESLDIARALHAYTSRMSAWTGNLEETVINMSLGVYMPDEDEQALNPIINWTQLKARDPISPLPVLHSYSLEEAINEADRKGAIIVAAAGNDSEDLAMPAREMLAPAKYENVIGVAATNTNGELSCYSNKGDVAAPGGEGGEVTVMDQNGTQTTIPCGPRADSWNALPGPYGDPAACQDPTNCAYGLVSLGQTKNGPQYFYWAGTSFAAPLVSGMAALAYEEMEKKDVICLIHGGTTRRPSAIFPDPELGSGRINIGNSFSPTVMQTVIQNCP